MFTYIAAAIVATVMKMAGASLLHVALAFAAVWFVGWMLAPQCKAGITSTTDSNHTWRCIRPKFHFGQLHLSQAWIEDGKVTRRAWYVGRAGKPRVREREVKGQAKKLILFLNNEHRARSQ
ncbi:hypothetical protein KGQ24_03535 [Patescibacteria group bacterium]|nr:hypothetical protein [Patescibacteria group bacterium]